MRGKLVKIEDIWMVAFLDNTGYHIMRLHPDDAKWISEERYIEDIDFKIVSHETDNKFFRFAKVIN
jgi:hypothetical protein